jgi:hypothetical protein
MMELEVDENGHQRKSVPKVIDHENIITVGIGAMRKGNFSYEYLFVYLLYMLMHGEE